MPLAKMRALVDYWRTGHNWRRCEAALARIPQYRTTLDGLGIHFIHVRSKHPNALPIVMIHGWPGSIVDFMEIVAPLTDPTAHGGRAEDAFHFVAPSPPGFGFSDKPRARGWNAERIAKAWGELMGRLGYTLRCEGRRLGHVRDAVVHPIGKAPTGVVNGIRGSFQGTAVTHRGGG